MKTTLNFRSAILSANKLGLIAILVAGIFAFSFKAESKKPSTPKIVDLYWYHVDPVTNETVGTAAFNDSKDNVISMQSCKDAAAQPICLYGSTNPSLPEGTDASGAQPAERILRNN